MRLLAVDTSSQSASCALVQDGALLGEFFTNVKLTHSQTILPMIHALLEQTRITPQELDGFGVTIGPGSFTGLRIGLSVVKGMAQALGKTCVGISTLETLAFGLEGADALIVPVLDARCQQVYTALFLSDAMGVHRLREDDALTIDALSDQISQTEKSIFLVGDGAQMCYNQLKAQHPLLRLAPPAVCFTRASAAARISERMFAAGEMVSAAALIPAYLRLPQAERELLAKQNQEDETT